MIDPKLSKFLYIADSKDPGSGYDFNQPNIVVPYANEKTAQFQACKLNLLTQGYQPRFVDLTGDDFAYDKLFRQLWKEGESFIIVESDIIPWPGALEQLWKCECIWGAYSYNVFGQLRVQLGCTKFNPKELEPIPLPEEKIHWSRLDWVIISNLAKRFESGHLHTPAVSHLNYAHKRNGKIDYKAETAQSAFG